PEDFSVTVTGIGAVQGSDTGTATIVDDGSGPGPDPDDDRPSVTITDAGTINEGDTANFKVTLSSASESSVQVELGLNLSDTEVGDLGTLEYNTGSGWVAVPNDGVVTVPAGQTEFDVRIASIDDAVYEGPEDFSVTVTGIGAVQGSDTGTATIVDDGSGPDPDPDDDRPSVAITDAGTINEGETANFKVTLSNASEAETQVELGFNLGDTEAGDLGILEYNTGSGWVAVPNDGVVTVPAEQTEFDVRIASIDDAVYEGSEDFSVTVTGIGAVQGSDTGTATIVDDGTGPGPDPDDDRPSVAISDAGTINEGDTANFKVTLSNASESTVQVELGFNLGDTEVGDLGTLEYNTGSGWVTVPNDGVVTVPAGQTEFDVRIASIDDAVYEGPEDFSVTVTGIGAVQGSDTGTATIVDDGTGPGLDPDDDRPSVAISDAGTINEGDTANFKVTLSNASESTVQVELGFNLGDTEVGDLGTLEYNTGSGWVAVPNDGVVNVPAGQTEFDVRVASIDDAVYEGPEDFSVTVTGIGAVQGSDTGTATIVDDGTGPGLDPDDDRPTVSITDAGIINEGDTANFKVTLSNASGSTVQVELGLNLSDTEVGDLGTLEYNTGSGWVAVPNDGVVTVPAGQTEFDVRIASIDDAVYEGPEDFSVTVTGIGAVQGSDTGTATIVDDGSGPGPDPDDDRPSVTITDAGIINEGDTANFKVTLSNASESTVQVELGLNLSDTEVGDLGTLEYNTGSGWVAVPNDGVVTVPAGQTEFDVRIASINDAVYEGPEDFSVTVTGIGAVQGSDTGTATIVDDGSGPGPDPDDDRPNIYIVEDSVGVNEGTDAVYTVRLSAAADIDVTVRLNTSTDGSNTAEADDIGSFVVTLADGVTVVNANSDGTYTIPAGENELKVTVPTTDDGVYEGDETFTVAVQGDTGVLGSDSALGIIYDGGNGPGPDPDDDRPSVYIVEDSVGVNEGTEAVYTVRLSEAADIDVTVRLSTSTGGTNTAEPGDIGAIKLTLSDGVTVVTANSDGTYTIPAGETDLKLFVPTTDDDVYEGDETFTVAVQGATGVLGTDTALGIIYDGGNGPSPDPDDDRPTVSISDAGIVDEGDIATFTVSLSNASEGTVQVQLTLNPDETEVDDLGSLEYNTGAGWVAVPVDGIVTVPAMLTEFDVRIATIDDEVYEGPEDFSVTVTGLGAVQGTDTGLATIVDDGTKTDDDRPTVSISDAGTIDEGNFATFTVSLSNASEAAVQVQLTLNLDETEVGDLGTLEYNTGSGWVSVPVSGIVTVPAGMTEFDLRIESIDDGVYEGPEDFSVTVTGLGAVQGSDTGLATIVDNSPPTARDFIISLDVQNGIFPVQDVEFDGLTTSGEQRVEDLEDDAVTANDDDILIQVVSLPEHGELYYVDGNGQEVIIDETTQFPENTEVKYRLTEDFFEEQSFDSADLLEEQGKDILVGSYTPPNSNLTFTGGQITTIGNSIIFDSDAQISVDFANQQVGLVVVSPNETGQGDEISTGEYITLELDEDLSANEAKLNLASLNDRFNSGGAWLTAYIFLNGALVDVQQFYSTDITYTSNHEGSITVALANGSFDEIRLTPETDSASDKAGFTLVGTEITSFTDVNDDFTYQAIDTDGAVSNEATVAVDFENVTVEAVTALGYQTMALNSDLNLVMGTDGDDILVGTEGNDLIIGGLGNDILTGGEGDDVFKWTEMQSATDTVTDFSNGDQLDFTDVFDDMSGTDISALLDDLGSGDYRGSVDDISVEVTESGGNSTLTINKDGQQLEVNFDGASAADIANSLISNLEQLRE
ncbi:Calx-beta domain-containing protein, partial [Vibrio diabolicus]